MHPRATTNPQLCMALPFLMIALTSATTYAPDARAQLHLSSDSTLKVTEILLGAFPTTGCLGYMQEAGGHIAYAVACGHHSRVYLDGQPGAECDGFGNHEPVFSKDGKHLAYAAHRGEKWFVVLDGKAGESYDEIGPYSDPVFSPDGNRLAYGAQRGKKWFAIVDGQAGPKCDVIRRRWPEFVFSADSRRVGYRAMLDGKWRVVVDGQWGPAYDSLGLDSPVFSRDGLRVAYRAWNEGKAFIIVDGRVEQPYGEPVEIVFSPDGNHVAYLSKVGNKRAFVVDGQPGSLWDGVFDFGFSGDGNHFAYRGRTAKQDVIVMDGKDGPVYGGEKIGSRDSIFSPDGKHWAYSFKGSDGCFVVVDGERGTLHERVGEPVFSADSKHLAYWASDGSSNYLILDGHPTFALPGEFWGQLGINANGDHAWFQLHNEPNGAHLVVDGQPGPRFHRILEPVFSPDGQRVAYAAETGQFEQPGKLYDKYVVVSDGHVGPEYIWVSPLPLYLPDGSLEFFARTPSSLLRVRYDALAKDH